MSDLATSISELTQQARQASLALATTSTEQRNQALKILAAKIEASRETLQAENERDLVAGREAGLSSALLDRLELTDKRIAAMAEGVRQVEALPDPLGEEIETHTHPQGMEIRKVRVPIGVVGIIFESRPNVTVDCAVLCLKSGNASILRGGKEAIHSNRALAVLVTEAVAEAGLPKNSVQLVPTTEREALVHLLRDAENVDCIIPRGGEGLIRFTAETALMPVIKHYKGVCNLFVDTAADAEMAIALAVNAKTQRPSVCNAIENLLVHRDLRDGLTLEIARALVAQGVELRVPESDLKAALDAAEIPTVLATEADFTEEYLDNILAVVEVADTDEAMAWINRYGSKHSDAIVTKEAATAQRFLDGIDSATVYWNASTRFTDGFEFGLGAEIGISTDKLHARGPMGLRELCSYKFLITGDGQLRS